MAALYYAALAQTWIGWRPDLKDKDANAEKIRAYLAKAEALDKNSELYAVENMSYTQEMLVDPQSRYMTKGKDAATSLQKGMQLDPNNPRLYYLQGMSIFGTPPQFGGGKDRPSPFLKNQLPCSIRPSHSRWLPTGDRNRPRTCWPSVNKRNWGKPVQYK